MSWVSRTEASAMLSCLSPGATSHSHALPQSTTSHLQPASTRCSHPVPSWTLFSPRLGCLRGPDHSHFLTLTRLPLSGHLLLCPLHSGPEPRPVDLTGSLWGPCEALSAHGRQGLETQPRWRWRRERSSLSPWAFGACSNPRGQAQRPEAIIPFYRCGNQGSKILGQVGGKLTPSLSVLASRLRPCARIPIWTGGGVTGTAPVCLPT